MAYSSFRSSDVILTEISTLRRLLDRCGNGYTDPMVEKYQHQLRRAKAELDMAKEHERRNPVTLPSPVRSFTDVKPVAKRKHQMNEKHLRDLLTGGTVEVRDLFTTGSAGNLVPQVYQDWLLATKHVGPLLGLVNRFDRVGQPQYVKATVVDDTATTMSYVGDGGSTAATSADSTISAVINGSDSIVTKVRYSIQLESDAFEFQKFLTSVAAQRVGRGLNYVLTNGKDSGTNTAMPNNVSLLSSAAVAGTAATAGAIAYADLTSTLKSSVDESYRQSGVYLASQAVHDLLDAAVDSTGRPLYEHDDQGFLLIGKQRLYINSAMVFASGKPAVAYGDFSKSVAYLDGGSSVRIIREAPGLMENFMHEALIYSRIGSSALLGNAVKVLNAT